MRDVKEGKTGVGGKKTGGGGGGVLLSFGLRRHLLFGFRGRSQLSTFMKAYTAYAF